MWGMRCGEVLFSKGLLLTQGSDGTNSKSPFLILDPLFPCWFPLLVHVCQSIQLTITSVQCQKRDSKSDLIRILSSVPASQWGPVRVFLIRIDFDEPHCKSNHQSSARLSTIQRQCLSILSKHKALFGPHIRSPTTKEMGKGFRKGFEGEWNH